MFALVQIDQEDSYADLGHIIKIRDIFAHSSSPVSFNDVDVKATVSCFKTPMRLKFSGMKAFAGLKNRLSAPRDQFILTTILLQNELLMTAYPKNIELLVNS